ncbi:MAG: hypothetical protein IJ151_02030 [Bacteroidales bacterium]|nr:hypothetical protein [Bacteroidales bacterium]
MKRLEDIEMMDAEQLEEAALREDIKVPAGLEERIKTSLTAATIAKETQPLKKPARWLPAATLAAAAAATALLVIPGSGEPELRDTFDDPYLAYAQVEQVFQTISDKMSVGMDKAVEARAAMGRQIDIMNKITER